MLAQKIPPRSFIVKSCKPLPASLFTARLAEDASLIPSLSYTFFFTTYKTTQRLHQRALTDTFESLMNSAF